MTVSAQLRTGGIVDFNQKVGLGLIILTPLFGCDGPQGFVYHCNNFSVKFANNAGNSLGSREFWVPRAGGADAKNITYIYPDGSIHYAKIASNEELHAINLHWKDSNGSNASAVCKRLRPGVVFL